MLPDSRTIAKATLLVLVAGVTPNALAAGGTPAPMPPPVIAPTPPGALPSWAIAVPVQLASIPPMYPRFSVMCQVSTPPIEHPFPFQSGNARVIGAGTQVWPLDSNGAYSGAVTVRVFVAQGYAAYQARGGGFACYLMVVDATNGQHLVGPNEDPSLRPQQGTTFVGQVTGLVPL